MFSLVENIDQSETESKVSNKKRVIEKWISYWSRFKLRNDKRIMIRSSLNSRNLDSDVRIKKNITTRSFITRESKFEIGAPSNDQHRPKPIRGRVLSIIMEILVLCCKKNEILKTYQRRFRLRGDGVRRPWFLKYLVNLLSKLDRDFSVRFEVLV